MSLIYKLASILEQGKLKWESTKAPAGFSVDDYTGGNKDSVNKLIQGDNISVCRHLIDNGLGGSLKLIYVDPPFFSNADYKTQIKLKTEENKSIPVIRQKAYKDSWEHGMEEYLTMVAARLFAFKELLSNDGTIWVHLDWHASHYVKVLMDEIFGQDNFINEIIWNYKSGGTSKRRYARKHDTLLFYGKGKDYYFKPLSEKSYNRGLKPYGFKGVKEYEDEKGWYTLVNMKDVWQIDMVGRTSAERTGYATQKPEALLSRIIESCTEEGDLCADFFGGSGTLAATAEKMNRSWISCDIGSLSAMSIIKRMTKENAVFQFLKATDDGGSGGSTHAEQNECIDVDFEVDVSDVGESGKKQISLKLTGYRLLDSSCVNVSKKDLDVIIDVSKKDFLQLIDCFAVDYDYDGRVFQVHEFVSKEGDYIEDELVITVETAGCMAVKVADIFGNSCFKILN